MTVPAAAQELGGRLPSASEKAAANHLRKILAAHATGDAKLRVLDDETQQPTEITLTPALSSLLMELLRPLLLIQLPWTPVERWQRLGA
nr:hypothetical protein [Sinorhizobium meliloti]